ncbi:FixH family protein [Silvibacterium acidisoli]|uniref:FixH family protein n=1 Tax=Acidobacteriaceae bacterium ZG23-2 TaxID=2883246 RepID=UPI00406CB32F
MIGLSGCHRGQARLDDASIRVTPTLASAHPHVGTDTLAIQLRGANGPPLNDARISVETEMNHPGMVPSNSTATGTAPGEYRAPVEFTMAGDYVIELHIRLADGRTLHRTTDIRGVDAKPEAN